LFAYIHVDVSYPALRRAFSARPVGLWISWNAWEAGRCGLLASGEESGRPGPSRAELELKNRLLTEPGDMVELALNGGDMSDGERRARLLYGLRGLPATRSSDS